MLSWSAYQSPCGLNVAATFFQGAGGWLPTAAMSVFAIATLSVAVTLSPALPLSCVSVAVTPGACIGDSARDSLKEPVATVTPSGCMVQPLR